MNNEEFNRWGPDGPPPEGPEPIENEIVFETAPDSFGPRFRLYADGGVEISSQGGPWRWHHTVPGWAIEELCNALARYRRMIRELLPICGDDCACEGANAGCYVLSEKEGNTEEWIDTILEANRVYEPMPLYER